MYRRSGEGTRVSRVASASSEKWSAMLITRAWLCSRESYVQILPPELMFIHIDIVYRTRIKTFSLLGWTYRRPQRSPKTPTQISPPFPLHCQGPASEASILFSWSWIGKLCVSSSNGISEISKWNGINLEFISHIYAIIQIFHHLVNAVFVLSKSTEIALFILVFIELHPIWLLTLIQIILWI